MKYALLGEAGDGPDAVPRLREALEFLVGDVGADRVLYLGTDALVDRVVEAWAEELLGEPREGDDPFLDRLAEVAGNEDPRQLAALLEADRLHRRLTGVHKLPPGDECVVEMVETRILVAVWDKARLSEEDIANAQILVYGRSDRPLLRRFGPRSFYTPGPLDGGEVGVLEALENGEVVLATYDPTGTPLGREELQSGQHTKMVVT